MAGLFDKAKDLINSDKGEEMTDKGLDGAAKLASERTGGAHDDKISGFRDQADKRIGTE